MATRIIHLRDESIRSRRINPHTLLVPGRPLPQVLPEGPSCEIAFVTAYDTIRRICTAARPDTVAVFAVDATGVAAHARFRARRHRVQTAIVGRHTGVDLVLSDDDRISLRHLALVIHPHDGNALRFHLLDLRTSLPLRDEGGRHVEHVAADGPMFVHLGAYALIVVPIDPRQRWPDDPLEGFRALPPRTYTIAEPSRRRIPPQIGLPPQLGTSITGIQVIRGPRFARDDGDDDNDVQIGEIIVRTPKGEASLVLGRSALRGGVLLGRYDRCDDAGLPILTDHRISRVHLLLIEIEDVVFAIDTGSTNGVWSAGTAVRQHRLATTETLELGRGLAMVTFRPLT